MIGVAGRCERRSMPADWGPCGAPRGHCCAKVSSTLCRPQNLVSTDPPPGAAPGACSECVLAASFDALWMYGPQHSQAIISNSNPSAFISSRLSLRGWFQPAEPKQNSAGPPPAATARRSSTSSPWTPLPDDAPANDSTPDSADSSGAKSPVPRPPSFTPSAGSGLKLSAFILGLNGRPCRLAPTVAVTQTAELAAIAALQWRVVAELSGGLITYDSDSGSVLITGREELPKLVYYAQLVDGGAIVDLWTANGVRARTRIVFDDAHKVSGKEWTPACGSVTSFTSGVTGGVTGGMHGVTQVTDSMLAVAARTGVFHAAAGSAGGGGGVASGGASARGPAGANFGATAGGKSVLDGMGTPGALNRGFSPARGMSPARTGLSPARGPSPNRTAASFGGGTVPGHLESGGRAVIAAWRPSSLQSASAPAPPPWGVRR